MDAMKLCARKLHNTMTDAERWLWQCLRTRRLEGFRFRRKVVIGRYIVDFLCPQARLVVEFNGGQHADRVQQDNARTLELERPGYRVLRYWNDDVLLRATEVADDIWRELTKGFTPPQPSPSLREREGAETAAETTAAATAAATTIKAAATTEIGTTETKPTAQPTGLGLSDDASSFSPCLSPQAKGRVGEGCS